MLFGEVQKTHLKIIARQFPLRPKTVGGGQRFVFANRLMRLQSAAEFAAMTRQLADGELQLHRFRIQRLRAQKRIQRQVFFTAQQMRQAAQIGARQFTGGFAYVANVQPRPKTQPSKNTIGSAIRNHSTAIATPTRRRISGRG